MIESKVNFIFFKLKIKHNTLHLVFADKDEKSNYISISSPICKINHINNEEYEIITKSNSHYFIEMEKKIFDKYNKQLEIFSILMKN